MVGSAQVVVVGSAAHLGATGLAPLGDLLALAAANGSLFTAQPAHVRAAQGVGLSSAVQVAATELAAKLEEGSAAPLCQGGPIAQGGGSSPAATGQSGALAAEPEATRRESVFVRWRRCQSQQRGGREVRTDKDNNNNRIQVRTDIHSQQQQHMQDKYTCTHILYM